MSVLHSVGFSKFSDLVLHSTRQQRASDGVALLAIVVLVLAITVHKIIKQGLAVTIDNGLQRIDGTHSVLQGKHWIRLAA
jgi:hypothetical protein